MMRTITAAARPTDPDGHQDRRPLFPTENEIDRLIVGPDSVAWQFGSDPRLYLGMLYPLLLQVAHPVVAAGVRDYSDFQNRPWNRLVGTLDYVTLLIYGGREAAVAGRRLRALHKQFKGTRPDGQPYYALEPNAYAWVHATLIEAYVSGHELFGRPMRPDQKERFLREYLGLGRFIGVREGDLPDTWPEFRSYFEGMLDTELAHTEQVDEVLKTVSHAQRPPLPIPDAIWRGIRIPARRALWLGGAGPMPPGLRRRLGVDWTAKDQRDLDRLGAFSRGLTPLMPRPLKTIGPMQLRMRRRGIARGPLGGAGAPPRTQ